MAYSFSDVATTMINLELGTTFSGITLLELGVSQANTWNYTGDNSNWRNYWLSTSPSPPQILPSGVSTSYLNLCDPGNRVRTMSQTVISQMGINPNKRVSAACVDFDASKNYIYYGDKDFYLIKLDITNPGSPSVLTSLNVIYEPVAVTIGYSSGEVVFLISDTGSSLYQLRVSDLSTNNLVYTLTVAPPSTPEVNRFRDRILDTLIFETSPNTFESLVCFLDRTGGNFFIIDRTYNVVWDYTTATSKVLDLLKFKISPPSPPGSLNNRQIYLYYEKTGSTSNDMVVIDVSYSGSTFNFTYNTYNIGSSGFLNDMDFSNRYGDGSGNDRVYFIDSSFDVSVFNFSGSSISNAIHSFPTGLYGVYPNKLITSGDNSDRYMVFANNGANNIYLCFHNCWSGGPASGWINNDSWFTASQVSTIYLEAVVKMDDKHFLFGGDGAANQDIAMLNTSAMCESSVASRVAGILSSSGHSWDFIRVNAGSTASYLYHFYGSGTPAGTGVLIWF